MNFIKTPIVDVLGGLLADKADIGEEIDSAKAYLIGQAAQSPNVCAFEGELFRATVTFGIKRVVDYKAILAELVADGTVDSAVIVGLTEKYTQVAEGVPTVRCTARKGA
jgi:hypothetical protein